MDSKLINQIQLKPNLLWHNSLSNYTFDEKIEAFTWYLSQKQEKQVAIPLPLIEDLLLEQPLLIKRLLLSRKLMRISKGSNPSLYDYIRIVKS